MLKTILSMIACFFAVWFDTVMLVKITRGQAVSAFTLVVMTAALALVLTHLAGVW